MDNITFELESQPSQQQATPEEKDFCLDMAQTVLASFSQPDALPDAPFGEQFPNPSDHPGTHPEVDSKPDVPRIEVVQGRLHDTLATLETILAGTGRFFLRSEQMVEVIRYGVEESAGEAVNHAGCEVRIVTVDSLQVSLASISQWLRMDKRSGSWTPCDPVSHVCRLLLAGGSLQRLQPLKGMAVQPYLRPDGSLCMTAGYDVATGIYGAFATQDITVHPNPSRDDALEAMTVLEDLVSEVAFASPQDRSAALSAILTAAVRPSLVHAPLFHVTAHQPGSGKSYLCDLIATLASAKPSSKATFPGSNDECGKLLLSLLMRSPAVIEFDNLTSDIKPHDKLCTALTSESIEGRVLSTSSTVGVSTRALFMSSGNNVKPIGDMLRRTMVIHLDPKTETPSARAFDRPNLLVDVRRERIRYVTAALTLVRAWLVSDTEPGTKSVTCRPLASFGDWSRWCREPLLWLGHEDPASGLFAGLENDPDKLLLGRVLTGWQAHFSASAVMLRQVVPAAMRLEVDDDFRDALVEASGGGTGNADVINVRKLGHWISRQEGRVVGGLRLLKARKTGSAQSWSVQTLD